MGSANVALNRGDVVGYDVMPLELDLIEEASVARVTVERHDEVVGGEMFATRTGVAKFKVAKWTINCICVVRHGHGGGSDVGVVANLGCGSFDTWVVVILVVVVSTLARLCSFCSIALEDDFCASDVTCLVVVCVVDVTCLVVACVVGVTCLVVACAVDFTSIAVPNPFIAILPFLVSIVVL